MSRRDRRPDAPRSAPAPVSTSPSVAASPAPSAPTTEALAAPVAAPRLLALCTIHAGVTYARGDEIPYAIAVQLVEGEHWHAAP